jgi:hypothetical protein
VVTKDANGVLIRSGNGGTTTANSQLTFGYDGTAQYRHAVKTRHHGGQLAGNAIDFFVWKYGVDGLDTIGTQQVMTLDGNGNVGVGVSAPAAKLHVITSGGSNPGTNGLLISNTSTATGQDAIMCARVGGTAGGNPFVSLDVPGGTGWSVGVDNADSQSLKFSSSANSVSGATKMTLNKSGNLGVGVAPTARLHVMANGTGPAANGLYVYNDLSGGTKDAILAARVKGSTGGSPYVSLDVDGVGGWAIGVDNSDSQALKISSAWDSLGSSRLTIDRASGNVGIGRRPQASGTMKLDVPRGSLIGTSDSESDQHSVANRGTKIAFGATTSEFSGMSVIVKEGTNNCGNSSDILFSTWECNTSTTREVMRVTGRGFVGIGTNAPLWPLHVKGFTKTSPANGNGAKMDYDNYDNGWDHGRTGEISIMADYAIASRTYFVCHEKFNSSDARIKNVIGRSNPFEDLAMLRRVPVTNYSYIDVRTQGPGIHKKIIAQELEVVYPAAVKKRVETIPNIYAEAVSSSFDEETKVLTIEMAEAPGLQAGDFVDLFVRNSRSQYQVISVEGTAFTVKAESDPGNVFVFGKQVDDFRIVDYDALFMLGISSIQALSNEVDSLKEQVSGLKKTLAAYSA